MQIAKLRLFLAAGACALAAMPFLPLGGCARVSAVTDIHPDGSFVRTITLKGSAPAPGNDPSAAVSMMGPSIDDLVIAPRDTGWDVKRTTGGDGGKEVTIIATRPVAAGQTISDDLRVRPPKSAPGAAGLALPSVLSNTVSVRRLPDNRLEYREVVRWRGPLPKALAEIDPQMLEQIKKTLPPALAADSAAVRSLASATQKDLFLAFFGPEDPLLGVFLTHPDLGEQRLRRRLAIAYDKALVRVFGAKISESDRRDTVRRAVDSMSSSMAQESRASAQNPESAENSDPPVALLLRVKLPGKIIATNGEADPITGEVSWGFYSEAAAAGELTFTATCEPTAP